jgi:hypothetical protein
VFIFRMYCGQCEEGSQVSLYLASIVPLTISTYPGCHETNGRVCSSELDRQFNAVEDDSLVCWHRIGGTVVSQ